MSVDPSRAEDPIEQLLLTAYPNPERKGCPGPEVLAELANKERDPKDPNWYHVWHCSPCYAEFKALRDARWGRERARDEQIKRRAWLAAAAGLTIAVGAGGVAWLVHEQHPGVEVAQVTLDLSNETARRGGGQDLTVKLPPLPRKLDEITILLPRFSDEGVYQVAILKSKSSEAAVALAETSTQMRRNQLALSVRLDLTKVPPQTYWLGTRLTGRDEVYYYPLAVR